MQKFNFKLR